MAIGALGAYIYVRKHQYTKWLYNRWTQIIAILAFVYIMIADISVNTYSSVWTASIYVVLIMNIATNEYSLVKLNNHLLEKLGEISYGLYVYHFPILYLIFFTAHRSGLTVIWTSPILLFMTTLLSTWLIAAVSYRWFEIPFLRLKKYFTVEPVNVEAIKGKHGDGGYNLVSNGKLKEAAVKYL
jgi:peptidoglycan/LPS O-acetylase OafA/YrhL